MKFRTLHSILLSKGYNIVRENKHRIYSNGHYSLAVPHSNDISRGTLRDIFKILFPNDLEKANMEMRQALGKAA